MAGDVIVKIQSHTRQGVGRFNEDAVVLNERFGLYGVLDGSTSLVPFETADGKTGGFLASRMVKNEIESLEESSSLLSVLNLANQQLGAEMKKYGIAMNQKEQLWCTAASLVQVTEHHVSYAQTGDTMILAVYEDEIRRLSRPQIEHVDRIALEKWNNLIHSGVHSQKELLTKIKEQLKVNRYLANTPDGYGVLNGETSAVEFVEYGQINRQGLLHLLLFSDGLFLPKKVVPEGVHYWEFIAKNILQKGLKGYIDDLVALEEEDPECLQYPRFKKSDDKTVVMISF